jgi:hypothetical protein
MIEILVLPVFHAGSGLVRGGAVIREHIGDDDARHVPQALEPFTQERLRRILIVSTLHRIIEPILVLINGPPQIITLALDREEDLIEMPRIPGLRSAVAEFIRIRLAERAAPFTDGFVRHHDSAGQEQLFDIAVTQTETKVQPVTVSHDFRPKSVARIRIGRRACVHVATMPHWPRAGQVGRSS